MDTINIQYLLWSINLGKIGHGKVELILILHFLNGNQKEDL